MPSTPRLTAHQHLVTRRSLRGFADDQGRLAVFDRQHSKRQLRSHGAKLFSAKFDAYDSQGSEDRWNLLEHRFPAALDRVRDRTALEDPEIVASLKDLLALHWARSQAIMTAREPLLGQLVADHKQAVLRDRPDLLAGALREELGLHPAGPGALEWMNERAHERAVSKHRGKWDSDRNPVNFATVRRHFEKFEVQIGHTAGHELLIGDAPVITTSSRKGGAGPHQGVAVMEADHVAMPIAPDTVLALGPVPAYVSMPPDVVAQYNRWQWQTCINWIAAQPGSPADLELKSHVALLQLGRNVVSRRP